MVGGPVSWGEFVRELLEAAQTTLFAAESRHAPVQILGVSEAAGLQFDSLWFLGMTEDQWPRPGRVHPLLAHGLQRDAGMPHSSPEVDAALAQTQTRRVLASAPVVVASYARQCAGVEARPSPLLPLFSPETGSPNLSSPDLSSDTETARLPTTPCELVRVSETVAVAPWPPGRPAGGSEVLKRQAACGFQSFATRRLGAEALDEEAWGLDAGQRATLLHRALEELWSTAPAPGRLHTHDDLQRAIDNGTIEELVQAAIARSFKPRTAAAAGDPWTTAYLALEAQRLSTRLLWWLDVEQRRAPFRVIGLEQKVENAPVGELLLNLRLDRVDEVAGGAKLLLDYKTAERVNIGLWEGARPDEPQLPIYALYGGLERVSGIAFAQIRAGKTSLHALANDPASEPGSSSPNPGPNPSQNPSQNPGPDKSSLFDEARPGWDQALRALAAQFAGGEAPVNPKHGEQTCRLCGLHGICRVRSQASAAELHHGEEDEYA